MCTHFMWRLLVTATATTAYTVWNISFTGFSTAWGANTDFAILKLLYWPSVIAGWTCFLLSISHVVRRHCIWVGVAGLILSLPMTIYSLYFPEYTSLKRWRFEQRMTSQWWNGAPLLNIRLLDFCSRFPNSVRWTGEDEQIDSRPFFEYLKSTETIWFLSHDQERYPLRITPQGILAPWGCPIALGVDRDGDGYVTIKGRKGSLNGYADPWAAPNYSYKMGVGCMPEQVPSFEEPNENYIVAMDDNEYRRRKDF